MKKLVYKNEFYVTVTLVVLAAIIQIQSGQFFSANNLVDLARACILPGMLTLGVMSISSRAA
jgi:simple sugar transport system permease protein